MRSQRNPRVTDFTIVVSAAEAPRGAMPPGVITSFRPPRGFRTANGTRTVSMCAGLVQTQVRRVIVPVATRSISSAIVA